jgi:prolyl oligopeptidase
VSPVISEPPFSPTESVTEILQGAPITDPYRWLEDQDSPRTREWIREQTRHARSYLDNVPGRDRIRERIREFLDTETYDSFTTADSRYFFRKRLRQQEQPSIYMREGLDGPDELLIDPSQGGTGKYRSVKPVRVSPDGRLLLYQVKEGGERTGTFALFDVERRTTLPDVLARGYLRGFAFAPDAKSFYYAHEAVGAPKPFYRAAYRHVLGSPIVEDEEIFCAGDDETIHLGLVSDTTCLGFVVHHSLDKPCTDFFLKAFEPSEPARRLFAGAEFSFGPRLVSGRILAITDRAAPNLRIVELRLREDLHPEWIEIVPESERRIHQWIVASDRILVSYIRQNETRVSIFDFDGNKTGEWPARTGGRTIRFLAASPASDEVIIESDSFTRPPATLVSSVHTNRFKLWAQRKTPFDSDGHSYRQVSYAAKDGTRVPMFLMGRREVLRGGCHPVIMTSYGGYGIPMTPQFSVFVAFLVERGCLFALPGIRGGSEFGAAWHHAARRRNRQVAYDDFLAAAEWLIATRRTTSDKLAIFGGSNSGLLVAAALTQQPDLFGAVVCMAPLADMLRYHRFDNAWTSREEFGTADDPDDFAALARYSPYHQVRSGVPYPPTLIVSGDRDQNCNPLHARKMTARLQANSSRHPILLDYSEHRGHSPVLPLSDRIEALTDRVAFVCDQLALDEPGRR